ncbi:hypothetical protein phytr_4760 [Candidatus Phycorickettsia trachydisci]|uniref:Methyltransferase FkbM domain-containing protein n=1 Tax=Candidatus Phycorickettsia trachydisci TaxID=2115978 RepID=A0A2P1P853_9RICK|nr:hypothetical protein [Candidatus Phycorickettsia trachydisci]AVP87425.1 hypothetical protein phytr_4760 [Candidatus Phycorickettsia trachydisci]
MRKTKLKDWVLILITFAFLLFIGDIIFKIQITTFQKQVRETIKEELYLNEIRHNLVQFLKVYTAYKDKIPLKLVRYGRDNDGGYIIPEKALEQADVLIGYGIDQDSSFEEDFARIYKKPSYGFDCGVDYKGGKNPLFTFINECISSDKFLFYDQKSSNRILSFSQQLDNLQIKDKKIFIKMDIEGGEYEVFDEILEYKNNITGIALELHLDLSKTGLLKALKLLRDLRQNFVLLHVHGNNYCPGYLIDANSLGPIPTVLELTYINKSLVTNYHIAANQSHPTLIDAPNDPTRKDVYFEILSSKACCE